MNISLHRRWRVLRPAAIVLVLALSGCGDRSGEADGRPEVTISCGSGGQDYAVCKRLTDEWSARSGYAVRLFTMPSSSSDTLAMFRQQFGARQGGIDVVMLDVVWMGALGEHLIDLRTYSKGAERAHFPALIANNTVAGRLLAMPWFTDAGVLYYRKDLLERYGETVPDTWDALAATAERVQQRERAAGRGGMQGYVFQGKAAEVLSCNALEWVASHGGGTIVEADGRISIDNARAAKALDTAAAWLGRISPKNVLSFGEEEARGVFQGGNAVFMRNWPYAWSLLQQPDSKLRGKIGVAALPRGGPDGVSASSLGGWQLGVSKYSRHPDAAASLVMFLTSEEVQKRRAIEASFNPTIPALYQDADVLAAAPFFGSLYPVFTQAVARPATVTGLRYNEVSEAFWNAAYATLSGKASGAVSVRQLARELAHIRRGRQW